MEKAVAKLRSTPEPGRFYVISSIIEDIRNKKRIDAFERGIIEECFVNIDTVASTSVLVQQIVDLVGQKRITCDDAYSILLRGLSTCDQDTVELSIHVISHGIMDVFHLDFEDKGFSGERGQHPLVKALALERRSGPTFISRIELYMMGLHEGWQHPEKGHGYFANVEPFLIEASSLDLGPSVRSCVVRMSCNVPYMNDVDIIVMFFIRLMRSSKLSEQEACILDILDVVFCPDLDRNGIKDDTVEVLLDSIFGCLMRSVEQGSPLATYVGAISMFLPTYAAFCMHMTVPLSLEGVRYGESEDSKLLFDLIVMILRSRGENKQGRAQLLYDKATLSILECACMRAEFYCQGNRIQQSVRQCLQEIELLMHQSISSSEFRNPYVPCRWDDPWDVFSWIAGIDIWCDGTTGKTIDAHRTMELRMVQTLSLLRHESISVRLQALHLMKRMARLSEGFSFFALPAMLHRVQASSSLLDPREIPEEESVFLKEILFTMSSLSHTIAATPFIVRTLQPFLQSNAPVRLQAVAYRVLSSIWMESGRAYSSLKIALLGCDMEDEVEVRAEKDVWTSQELALEKLAVATTLISICSNDPSKGRDFVHMIHACVCSRYPVLSSTGLECIRLLCISDVLDFPKAWKVVQRTHPDLPSNDLVASSWIDLISCALHEDPERHEQMVRNVMEVSWGAVCHDSVCVRAKGYAALQEIDWEVAESLDCLRRPLTYAELLYKENDNLVALRAFEKMMDKILLLEFSDRRRQYLHLAATLSTQMKQSHTARYYKLSQSIPKVLLDEIKCGNSVLPSSGSGSQIFVILNLWMPVSRKGSQVPLLYQQVAHELLSSNSLTCFDIIMDLDNIALLCEGWRCFFHRWFASCHPDVSIDLADYHKFIEDAEDIWNECFTNFSEASIVNPNIPCAAVAVALQFGDAKPSLTTRCFEWIFSISQDRLQHPNIRNLTTLLLGILYDKIKLHVGDSTATEAISFILESTDVCMKHRCLALKHCLGYPVSEKLLGKCPEFILGVSGMNASDLSLKKNASGDLSVQSIALGALGVGMRHHILDGISPLGIIAKANDFFVHLGADDPLQELIPGYCELVYNAAVMAFSESEADDEEITQCLSTLRDFLKRDTSYKGYVVLAIAKILTSTLKEGYLSNTIWNIDVCVSILREHLSIVTQQSHVWENVGQVCKGLTMCLEYQMYHEKNQDQACTEENAAGMNFTIYCTFYEPSLWTFLLACAENELASICTLDASHAVRMGCIPHIATMCRKAIDFKRTDESQSLESFSSSAIGYLSEVLISQTWPNLSGNAQGVSKHTTITLLSCVGRAPRLPRKDWTACVRRCMRLYPEDVDVHVAVMRFVIQRASAGTLDNLRDFVTNDVFSLHCPVPMQSGYLIQEARYLAFANIHLLVKYLNDEERSQIITCLAHLVPPGTRLDTQLAHAVCRGLHSIVMEGSESMVDLALDVMVQIMFNVMDASASSTAMLCSLYRLDNDQLSSRVDEHDRRESSIIDEIHMQADIGALLIASYRIASPEMQRAFCQNMVVFQSHPILHTWLSCALMTSIDIITATSLSRNHIMTHGSDIDILSRILAEGFRCTMEIKGGTQATHRETLAWLTTVVGTHHTTKVPKGAMHTAIMCLAGLYAAHIEDFSFSLSLESAILVLPKAVAYFMQHHEDIFSNTAQAFSEYII